MKQAMRMREKAILRVVSRGFVPYILLLALYVQFHGDFGPGGGFQAGVIFSAALILYGLIFGLHELKEVMPPRLVEVLSAGGVFLYGSVGVASMLLGSNYLDYDPLAGDVVHGQHYGIIIIELGVGITVTTTMTMIFYAFAGRGANSD